MIDYNKIEENKQKFFNNGEIKPNNYQTEFKSWLLAQKDCLENALQSLLEEAAISGKFSNNINIETIQGDSSDAHKVAIAIDSVRYITPAIIFETYADNSGRHSKKDSEIEKEFYWYVDRFYEFFDEIGLRYKPTNLYTNNDHNYILKIFI